MNTSGPGFPSYLPMEPEVNSATEFPELAQFTVLKEREGVCYYRLIGKSGSSYDGFEVENNLDRAYCLEKAFLYPYLHKVMTYSVGREPNSARLLFQSRAFPSNPLTEITTIPPGVHYTINWYHFRAIPVQYHDLTIGDSNHYFPSFATVTWFDLESILIAFNDPKHYKLIVEGDPISGRPVAKLLRSIG